MESEETRLPPFTVTRAAIDKIEALGGLVRIDAAAGGCSGTTFEFSTDWSAGSSQGGLPPPAGDSDETRYGCPGAWLVVTDRVADLLPGATLDYSDRIRPPRFRVLHNPNTPQVCPCRRSFGEPWPGPRQPTCQSYQPMPWDEDFEPPRQWRRQTNYRGRSNE